MDEPVSYTLRFLAILFAVGALFYVFYMNYLPFGFHDIQVIEVGAQDDSSGSFALVETGALGPRQEYDGMLFREIRGVAYAVYSPKPVLRNMTLKAEIEGLNVHFIQEPSPEWQLDLLGEDFAINAPQSLYEQFMAGKETDDIRWRPFAVILNYNASRRENLISGDINLSQDASHLILSAGGNQSRHNLPDYYLGNMHQILLGYDGKTAYLFLDGLFLGRMDAQIRDIETDGVLMSYYHEAPAEAIMQDEEGCFVFDGKTRLVFPGSSDSFEEGQFAAFLEWVPELQADGQQLLGHYNWEIIQNKESVRFQVGRTYREGPIYSINHPVSQDFFGSRHNLTASYMPSVQGYIQLFVDGKFAGRAEIGNQTIWSAYGKEDLSIGWTPHNGQSYPHFKGSLCRAKYTKHVSSDLVQSISLQGSLPDNVKLPIYGQGYLEKVSLEVR